MPNSSVSIRICCTVFFFFFVMTSESLPWKPRSLQLKQEIKEKTQNHLSPKVTRGHQGSGFMGHKFPMLPHQSLLGSSQRCSTKNLPFPPIPSSLLVSSWGRSRCWRRAGRGGAAAADASLLLSGVTGSPAPSECGLQVGVQDGLSVRRLNVVGSFLKFQQHGHQGI